MNDFEQALQDLVEEIRKLPLIKTYWQLHKEIEENVALQNMKQDMQKWQRQMTLHLSNPKMHQQAKENYEHLLQEYQNHPLIQNYQQVKEEVQDLLFQIKEILEK